MVTPPCSGSNSFGITPSGGPGWNGQVSFNQVSVTDYSLGCIGSNGGEKILNAGAHAAPDLYAQSTGLYKFYFQVTISAALQVNEDTNHNFYGGCASNNYAWLTMDLVVALWDDSTGVNTFTGTQGVWGLNTVGLPCVNDGTNGNEQTTQKQFANTIVEDWMWVDLSGGNYYAPRMSFSTETFAYTTALASDAVAQVCGSYSVTNTWSCSSDWSGTLDSMWLVAG